MSRFPRPGRTPRPRPVPTAGPTPSPTPGPGPIGEVFNLTPSTDLASSTFASQAGIPSTFRLTNTSQTIEAAPGTIQSTDTLLDPSTADEDVFNASLTGTANEIVTQNIENFNLTFLAGTPLFQLDNVFGSKTVNIVGGNVAGTVDGFTFGVNTPSFNINNFTKSVTLAPVALTGTVDVLNVGVSGLSFGASTALQSAIVIDSAASSGVLETLNLTSNGSSVNDFSLTLGTNEALTTLNLLGSAGTILRVTSAGISGVTVNGGANSGVTTLAVDRNGSTSSVLNAANFSGIDNLLLVDSTVGTDAANVGSVQNQQLITFGSDFAGSQISARSGASSVTFALQNVTANQDVDISGTTELQNVATLNIDSFGLPAATTSSTGNSISSLVGDFTAINVGGNTVFDVTANIDAPASGTRTVAVNASALSGNAFIDFDAVANAGVVYQVTGSPAADIVVLNNSGGSIISGLGNDLVTGGTGNDTIDAGAGNDVITVTAGVDLLTGGLGINTFDVNSVGSAASAQTAQIATSLSGFSAANDALTITINGLTYTGIGGTSANASINNFVAVNSAAILAQTGVTVTSNSPTAATTLDFTGASNGTAFTISGVLNDGGTFTSLTFTGSAGSVGAPIASTITDWSTNNILDFAGVSIGSTFFSGAAASLVNTTAYGAIVITDTAYASIGAAEDAVAAVSNSSTAGYVYFLNSSTGSVTGFYDSNIGADGNLTSSTSVYTLQNITTLAALGTNLQAGNFILP